MEAGKIFFVQVSFTFSHHLSIVENFIFTIGEAADNGDVEVGKIFFVQVSFTFSHHLSSINSRKFYFHHR